MSDKKISFISMVLALVFFLLIAAGCEKAKTEKSTGQKISQLQNFALPQVSNDLDLAVEVARDKGDIFEISGWVAIKNQDSLNASKYLVLQSQNKTYIFDTFSLWKRPDVTQAFKMNRDDSGYNVFIPKDKVEKGDYKLGMIIKKDKTISLQYIPGKTLKF